MKLLIQELPFIVGLCTRLVCPLTDLLERLIRPSPRHKAHFRMLVIQTPKILHRSNTFRCTIVIVFGGHMNRECLLYKFNAETTTVQTIPHLYVFPAIAGLGIGRIRKAWIKELFLNNVGLDREVSRDTIYKTGPVQGILKSPMVKSQPGLRFVIFEHLHRLGPIRFYVQWTYNDLAIVKCMCFHMPSNKIRVQ